MKIRKGRKKIEITRMSVYATVREREIKREYGKERKIENMKVCVCVCEHT
jgi:hypothetical protein